jgi:succinyl-CoA synthetase beta subunit
MDLYEYQAKDLFRAAGMPVPAGEVATTPDEAERIAAKIGGTVVVKAQVHAGGRGKAGGVKLAKSPAEAREHASRILGMKIKGLEVRKVLVTAAEDIASEAYVSVLVDRKVQAPVFIASAQGGIDIEEVAATNPDALRRLRVDPRYGLLPHQAYALADFLYSDSALANQAARIVGLLYDVFVESSCSLA